MVLVLVDPMVVSALDAALQPIEVIYDQIFDIRQVLVLEHPLLHALGQRHSNRRPVPLHAHSLLLGVAFLQ